MVILAIAISSLRKLKTNDLAITKTQIWLHLGSFAAFTATTILLFYAVHMSTVNRWLRGGTVVSSETYIHKESTAQITIELICVLFMLISELPIIHIVDSLVQRNIWEVKMEAEEI